MKKNIGVLILVILVLFNFSSCSKKGDAIIEPLIGSYKFTTYTVDTFRFRVILNDVILSDSLLSPISSIIKQIEFTTDTVAKLKVTDAATNQIYIDTLIPLKTGVSTISIVQLISGINPAIPPTPNEAAPVAGNCKIRFQYVQPTDIGIPFFDSIRCFIKRTLSGTTPSYDTIVLRQYELSKFYDGAIGSRYSIIIRDPQTNDLIHNGSSAFVVTSGFPDFSTTILYGTAGVPPGPYNFRINRIY